MSTKSRRSKPERKPSATQPNESNGKSVLQDGGRRLRTLEDIAVANEQIFDAIEHGRCSPKQMEQMNTVIKSQIKVRLELPLRTLQMMRDLRKAGIDMTGSESMGTKLLNANPALKELIAGEAEP